MRYIKLYHSSKRSRDNNRYLSIVPLLSQLTGYVIVVVYKQIHNSRLSNEFLLEISHYLNIKLYQSLYSEASLYFAGYLLVMH